MITATIAILFTECFYCSMRHPKVCIFIMAFVVIETNQEGMITSLIVSEGKLTSAIWRSVFKVMDIKKSGAACYPGSLISEPVLVPHRCSPVFLFGPHQSLNYVRIRTQGSCLLELFSFWSIMFPQEKHRLSYGHILCHWTSHSLREGINSNISGSNS